MSVVEESLIEFECFVRKRQRESSDPLSLENLMLEWCNRHDYASIREILVDGFNAIDLGLGKSIAEVNTALNEKIVKASR